MACRAASFAICRTRMSVSVGAVWTCRDTMEYVCDMRTFIKRKMCIAPPLLYLLSVVFVGWTVGYLIGLPLRMDFYCACMYRASLPIV